MDSETDSERTEQTFFDIANIFDIDDELLSQICFREQLIIGKFEPTDSQSNSVALPTPVGGMCLDIQSIDNKIVVYVSTRFSIDKISGGSKITSWISLDLNTIEEKRIEFLVATPEERQCLYVASQPGNVYIRHEDLAARINEKKTYELTEDIGHLIGEGANFVLQRLLAVQTFIGEFETTTLYINGDICRNYYICEGPVPSLVNDTEVLSCKIRRTIVEECGIIHHCVTTLTVDGRLIKNEWNECAYAVYINPLANVLARGEHLPLALTWKDDMQMFSKYLDQKHLCTQTTNSYIHDTPELVDLLSDYVATLMHLKPDDVLAFTIDHFKRYGD